MNTNNHESMKQHFIEGIKRVFQIFLSAISRNLGWKIFSLLCAILLWSYLITSDSTITRDKTVSNVEITTSGLSVLNSRELALLTDPTTLLGEVNVRVRVPQAEYSRVSSDTVRVELDLSQIRQTGRQEVELVGISNYGEVLQVIPSRIEIVVEELDQRTIPVNVELVGTSENSGYWYNISRINPINISVSGPASLVEQVASARATIDVTGLTQSYVRSAPTVLLDASNNELPSTLSKSSSSVAISVSAYPVKQISISASIDTATVGTPLEGYTVSHIRIQPDVITVAGSEELLAELEELSFTPIDLTGRKQSFSTVLPITTLNSLAYMSSEEVTITVYIEELDVTRTFRSISLSTIGKKDTSQIMLGKQSVDIKITGPYSSFESLTRDKITARVNVADLSPGSYTLPVEALVDNHPEFTFEVEPKTISVTVLE